MEWTIFSIILGYILGIGTGMLGTFIAVTSTRKGHIIPPFRGPRRKWTPSQRAAYRIAYIATQGTQQ